MKCFGVGIRSTSGINYFGVELQSKAYIKGVCWRHNHKASLIKEIIGSLP